MKNLALTLEKIIKIDSPTGYTHNVTGEIEKMLSSEKAIFKKSNKGALLVSFKEAPELVLTAHVDTLGAMVKEVKTDGTLELTTLGSYPLNSFEGEYVRVRNFKGEIFTGTFLLNDPADHVNRKVRSATRDVTGMSIRLDENVSSDKHVHALGIQAGDFVFYDTRFENTKTGYIKSRFLDDKACVAILIELIKEISQSGKKPNVGFYFSNYEEVGHGGCSGIPLSTKELLVLDMAVIGEGCTGKEDAVSVCAKDSSGPYDFFMTKKLKDLAHKNKLNYVTDIYPFYGSDGSAALKAGYDVRVGLIGPGVSASHGVERTHIKGMEQTYKLAKAFIENFK